MSSQCADEDDAALRRRINGPYRHGLRWRFQVRDGKKYSHVSFGSKRAALEWLAEARVGLQERSERLLRLTKSAIPSRSGWIYAASTAPDLDVRRIKVGFTKDIVKRMAGYRTANPTAILIGLWEAEPSDEIRAHQVLSGRVGNSECFTVSAIPRAIAQIESVLGPRMRAPEGNGDGVQARPVRAARAAAAAQPDPEPNANTPIADLVIADVRARQAIGQRRYGTDLQAHNGRDALADAYQEAIDLAMYLRQALEERDAK